MRRILFAASWLLGGCASVPVTPPAAVERVCLRPGQSVPPDPLAAAPPDGARRLAEAGFRPRAVDVAGAIGATAPLLRLVSLEPGPRRAVERLEARLRVHQLILLATLDLNTVLAEIDCEGERGDQLRNALLAAQERRARRLAVVGLMAGAGTAAATGGLTLAGTATAASIAGIAGGTAEAGLAGALLIGEARAPLRMPRNLLREVWEQPERSRLMPPSVWHYLTLKPRDGPRRIDLLRQEWGGADLLGAEPQANPRATLLLGDGGTFDAAALAARGNMLDLLQASVGLMNQELRLLLNNLERLEAAATPAPAR